MTAITTRPISTSRDALLRFALRADATMTGLCGLALAAFADQMSGLTGFTATQEWIMGASFVAYGAVLYGLAALQDLRVAGAAVIVGNVVFAVLAVVVVVAGWFPLTSFGVTMTLATGVVTLAFADLQYLGVRRLRA